MTPTPGHTNIELAAAWVIAACTSAVSQLPELSVVVQLVVLGWTLHRWWNERKRTRILEHAEAAQIRAKYHGPFRRATDAVHAGATTPGAMTQ